MRRRWHEAYATLRETRKTQIHRLDTAIVCQTNQPWNSTAPWAALGASPPEANRQALTTCVELPPRKLHRPRPAHPLHLLALIRFLGLLSLFTSTACQHSEVHHSRCLSHDRNMVSSVTSHHAAGSLTALADRGIKYASSFWLSLTSTKYTLSDNEPPSAPSPLKVVFSRSNTPLKLSS